MELLRLERAVIGYRQPLLPPLELTVRQGQRLAVLGPNGSGKTTLLRSLLGLVPLLEGRRTLPDTSLRLGYVPQAHRADPVYPLTAFQVTLQGRYGLIGLGRFTAAKDRQLAMEKLKRVGMAHKAGAPFRALSGGERQRVLLARALCGEPALLVLDEFTSDLDPAASAALLEEVAELADKARVSVVFVTHEIAAAAAHATQVALVDTRTQVFETGPAEGLLTSERMSRLYGRPVRIERIDGRTQVFVEARAHDRGAP
ncbi:MAG: metal ABC transporter ATP-binding protein [Myxococcota bacterium]